MKKRVFRNSFKERLLNEYLRWLNESIIEEKDNLYSITLLLDDFNKKVKGERGNREKYEDGLRFYINRLNKRIFGNHFYRRSNGIEIIIPFYEEKNSFDRNCHYHLIMKKPEQISDMKFRLLLTELWNDGKNRWSRRKLNFYEQKNIDIQKFYNNESYSWVNYGLKGNVQEKVDLKNLKLSELQKLN